MVKDDIKANNETNRIAPIISQETPYELEQCQLHYALFIRLHTEILYREEACKPK